MKRASWCVRIMLLICIFAFSACHNGNQSHVSTDTALHTTSETVESGTVAHVHVFGEWSTVKEATCTANGEQERFCACGARETQSIDATGHTEAINAAVAATCTTDGKTEGKHCSVCHEILVAQNIIPASHIDGEWITDSDATCTENGSMHHVCTVCGVTIKTKTIAAKGHTAGDWIVDKNATCTEDGSEHQICSVCNATIQTKTIDAKGHQYSETLTQRDCAHPAKITYACLQCSYVYEELVNAPRLILEHKGTSSATMNGYGRFSFNYAVSASDGYGKMWFKYELFTSMTESVPATTIDFTEERGVSVSYTGYADTINDYVYKISVKDEAGNLSIYWFKLEDCSVIKYEDASVVEHSYENKICDCGRDITADAIATYDLSKDQDGSIIAYLVSMHDGKKLYVLGKGEMKNYSNITREGHTLTPFKAVDDIEEVYFSDQITSIGSYLLYFCQGITEIKIPNSVKTIGNNAFIGCSNIKTLILHEGLLSIGDEAFSDTGIQELRLPASIQYIGGDAFRSTNLEGELIVPSSVEFLGKGFVGYTNLSLLTVDSSNKKYHSNGNCIIETATKTLVAGCKSSIIPSDGSVTSIEEYAFAGCAIAEINIPDTVTSIGSYAFSWYTLQKIFIPDSVVYVGRCAFYGNTDLRISCEVSCKPDDWDDDWNRVNAYPDEYAAVVWGCIK